MRRLWLSEWERLWLKKSTWFFFLSIWMTQVVGIWVLWGDYLQKESGSTVYLYSERFIIESLILQLISIYPIVLLFMTVSMFTEEYRTGQLRMILQRAFAKQEIFLVKGSVLVSLAGLILMVHAVISVIIGFFLFRIKEELAFGSLVEQLSMSLGYYGLGYLSLIALLSVFMLIAVSSFSTTTALLTGVGFLIFSFAYPNFLMIMIPDSPFLTMAIFTSIITLQYHGFPYMLSEAEQLLIFGFSILCLYIICGLSIAYFLFSKKDYFH